MNVMSKHPGGAVAASNPKHIAVLNASHHRIVPVEVDGAEVGAGVGSGAKQAQNGVVQTLLGKMGR